MPEPMFFLWLAVDLGLIIFTFLGVVIWTGRLHGRSDADPATLKLAAGIPRLALVCLIVRLAFFLRPSLDHGVLFDVWLVFICAWLALSIIKPNWRLPNWTLPPWYRDYLKAQQSQNDGNDMTGR